LWHHRAQTGLISALKRGKGHLECPSCLINGVYGVSEITALDPRRWPVQQLGHIRRTQDPRYQPRRATRHHRAGFDVSLRR
jgi:hypothetical protein